MSTALVIAAHPDDEVLGCGGTIARLASEGWQVHVHLLANGVGSRADAGASVDADAFARRRSEAQAACKLLGVQSLRFGAFPDNRMDSVDRLAVAKSVSVLIDELKPACVFTHRHGDVNVDHDVVHDAVLAACRPQPGHPVRELLFFEVPSSTEWRPPVSAPTFAPAVFFDIAGTLQVKLHALAAYSSELRPFPHPRSLEAIEHLARWRGATVGVLAAEAFEIGRRVI
jgi:LmbE family N-acetylglucosaminyl deacetylase